MRYGRITASKVYEASKCNTTDCTLVKQILGISKIKLTKAMNRGIHLEEQVSLIFKNVSRFCNLSFITLNNIIYVSGYKTSRNTCRL